MKRDQLGCLIRERYDDNGPDWAGNYGDSCAETFRAFILDKNLPLVGLFNFHTDKGYVRHPKVASLWPESDFTGDQFIPLIMVFQMIYPNRAIHRLWKVPGTNKWLTPAGWFLVRKHYRLFNLANIVQGWIFNLSWRIADGGKIERSEGKVQDWLNYIAIYVFLKRIGKWATLNQSEERCMKAIRKYYLEGNDKEPNGEWVVEMFRNAIKKV